MLLKHFLLTALFSLGSVTASAEANVDNADMVARDVEVEARGLDTDADLEARSDMHYRPPHHHKHHCGWEASWDHWKKQCVCKHRDQ